MRRLGTVLLIAVFLCSLFSYLYWPAKGPAGEDNTQSGLRLSDVLGGTDAGFATVTGPRVFRFPADHGAHPDYRTEWWYFTGHLSDAKQRRFGFQLTFFRFALRATPVERESAWATNNVYMAHFALTDVAGGRFHSFERVSRGALDLAGVRAAPFRVWTDGWSAASIHDSFFPLQLEAAEGDISLSLQIGEGKPRVLQGDAGFSAKGAAPGNASHYYSYTRLPIAGSMVLAGTELNVAGTAWFDREWSTSALADDQAGWDWFAIQLDDGRDIMFYQLRKKDGAIDSFSSGVIVAPDGSTTRLSSDDVHAQPVVYWASPLDGARYPTAWHLRIAKLDLALEVTADLSEQVHDLSVSYWEGAASVRGEQAGRRVAGQAYIEMTGYAP